MVGRSTDGALLDADGLARAARSPVQVGLRSGSEDPGAHRGPDQRGVPQAHRSERAVDREGGRFQDRRAHTNKGTKARNEGCLHGHVRRSYGSRRRLGGLAVGDGILRGQSARDPCCGQDDRVDRALGQSFDRRITAVPLNTPAGADDDSLVAAANGRVVARRRVRSDQPVRSGNLTVANHRPSLRRSTSTPRRQTGSADRRSTLASSSISFSAWEPARCSASGEGGPQFDRKGIVDRGRNGQGGYQLRTHGGRVPIQWLVGTDGWGMFIHQPLGAFDLHRRRRADSRRPATRCRSTSSSSAPRDPDSHHRANTRASPGIAELPALWTFGYMQSHRTLAGPDEVMWVARTFREKTAAVRRADLSRHRVHAVGMEHAQRRVHLEDGELPRSEEDDRRAARAALPRRAALVIEGRRMTGTVHDPCTPTRPYRAAARRRQVARRSRRACYWPYHKPVFDLGIDGWWPDQGDGLDAPSRLARIRMYWEGPQLWRPNERPFALHRNGYAGHAALRRVPLVGRRLFDVGDAEDARAGRDQHRPVGHSVLGHRHRRLRPDRRVHRRAARALVPVRRVLPAVPRARPHVAPAPAVGMEHRRASVRRRSAATPTAPANPTSSELHNAAVEPICSKYLELRYRHAALHLHAPRASAARPGCR